MNILVILAHPDASSFNHAIAETAVNRLKQNGHHIFFHDLYEEEFDPLLKPEEIPKNGPVDHVIQKHCEELSNSHGIIIVHPNWWGQPPAILKGWIDRVIRPGIAYEFQERDSGEGIPVGLLQAQSALVLNTSNTSDYREDHVFFDPLETLWKNCIFGLCGVRQFYRKMFRIIVTSTAEQRQKWFDATDDIVNKYFPA